MFVVNTVIKVCSAIARPPLKNVHLRRNTSISENVFPDMEKWHETAFYRYSIAFMSFKSNVKPPHAPSNGYLLQVTEKNRGFLIRVGSNKSSARRGRISRLKCQPASRNCSFILFTAY